MRLIMPWLITGFSAGFSAGFFGERLSGGLLTGAAGSAKAEKAAEAVIVGAKAVGLALGSGRAWRKSNGFRRWWLRRIFGCSFVC